MQNVLRKTGLAPISEWRNGTSAGDAARPRIRSISVELLTVFGLAVLGILIRLVCIRFSPSIDGDGIWYATLGAKLIRGDFEHGLSTYWPPLYPALIGLVSLFTSDL